VSPRSFRSRFRLSLLAASSVSAAALLGCGSPPAPTSEPPPAASATATAPATAPGAAGKPTVEEARAFVARLDADVRRLWIARDRAGWVRDNFITDDTEFLAAQGEEETAEYFGRATHEAQRFAGMDLPPEIARQLLLLRVSQTVPAPADAKKRNELATVESEMTSIYGKGTYCPPRLAGKCLHLDDLSKIMATSHKYDELLEAWTGWHAIARPMKDRFATYAELGNEGSREVGFADLGAAWRSGYDMPPEAFAADVERLWTEVKPLYDQLQCYVRGRLRLTYGKDKVPDHGAIPAHLLGNMWAQEWNNIYDLVEPYKGEPSLDVSKKLKAKGYDPIKMVKLGESFFTSLGFDPLPKTFWERSLFSRPRDREVVCHASAWDPQYNDDLRIKVCVQPTEEDLITLHHELGHDFYFQSYFRLPILFQQGANDGFHEGIGDTLALSVTPDYLKSIGLLDSVPKDEKGEINEQMKMALDKVAFLPFGLLVDKWRWDVFSGKIPKERYNQAWWEMRRKYQGVSEPVARTEADFDPGAKYHVAGSTPYMRYFLARIYQFQFHRALCKAAGDTGPLDKCSIYGNKAAGEKLKAMLALGASKPWPEAMQAIAGEDRADATAMLEYFAPLKAWLEKENKGQTCGF
jgi:peptidyl-dipeptidase A